MRALEVNGRIEAVQVPDSGGIVSFFNSIGEQISTARNEVNELMEIASVSFAADARSADQMRSKVTSFRDNLTNLEATSEDEAA